MIAACNVQGSETDDAGDDDPGPRVDAAPDSPPCYSLNCAALGASCGIVADAGCGEPIDCGACTGTATCGGQGTPNVCAIPEAERECLNGWCWEAPSPFSFAPTDVFARTPSDVWMIGERGIVKHFDGTRWTPIPSGTDADLRAIWMASATDGWIVGTAGTLRRWNGTVWTAVASGTTGTIAGVYGTAANSVWIVGGGGTKRWNGTAWSPVGPASAAFDRVFATAGGNLFATADGRVHEYTAGAWTARTSADSGGTFDNPYFTAIAGVGSSVYAVGGVSVLANDDYEWLWRWNGTAWSKLTVPGNGVFRDAYVDNGTVYAPTERDLWNLAAASSRPGPPGVAMKHVAGAGGEVFAPSSSNGVPHHWAAGAWTAPPHTPSEERRELRGPFRVGDALWFGRADAALEWRGGLVVHARTNHAVDWISGTGRDDVWTLDGDAIGGDDAIEHFDGRQWSKHRGPATYTAAIRATATEVHVFGRGLFRRDGTAWVPEPLPEAASWSRYAEVGDDLFVVGNDATVEPAVPRIAARIGGAWSAIPPPAVSSLCGIAATSATDLWVAGQDRSPAQAAIAHWDGTAWTVERPPGVIDACAIALHTGEVWVAGTRRGSVLHRDAAGAWTTLAGAATGDLDGLAIDTDGTLWAAGDSGTILRRLVD